MRTERRHIETWARPSLKQRLLLLPRTSGELASFLNLESTSLIPRGMGRSYGDAPLADQVMSNRLWRNRFDFDTQLGRVWADAGWSLGEVVRRTLPEGWMPRVLPGTQHVSLGGAMAADVHGKNHHVDGSFSRWVRQAEVLLASGEIRVCSRDKEPALFRAICGGMGLTGCITALELDLQPVNSDSLQRTTQPCNTLDEALDVLRSAKEPYTVAWVDAASHGRKLGRSLVYLGEWQETAGKSVSLHKVSRLGPPRSWPINMVRPPIMRAFNGLVWRSGLRHQGRTDIQHYTDFFWPLDKVKAWNRLYGKPGFFQFQCLLPETHLIEKGAATFQALLELFRRAGGGSLAVMKTMGPRETHAAPISFPGTGATLALDLPDRPLARKAIRAANRIVANLDGRIYLAKDMLLEATEFHDMIEDAPSWRKLRDEYDPGGRWQSDLSRRLEL